MALSKFMGAAEILSNINGCCEFVSWTASAFRTAVRVLPTSIKEEIEQLEKKLSDREENVWKPETTMPKMRDLIDRVEFQSHKEQAAAMLPDIKHAVSEAEDLLDEFFCYYKAKVKCSKNSEDVHLRDALKESLARVGSDDYIREVNRIQAKLDHVHLQAKDMGLHDAPLKFDDTVRPETESYLIQAVFGREVELKQLLRGLGVPAQNRGRTKRGAGMTEVLVLSIVGMAGVGKTTMAQQICKKVEREFDVIIWTCVSDDFDIKRLIKEIIEGLGGKSSSTILDALMRELEDCAKLKKFLLILDDIWDDILGNDGAKWKKLFAPLKNGAEGSRILVTTRFTKVAELVGPEDHCCQLKGLQDAVFWDFFKLCAFGSKTCTDQNSLEDIGKKIVPKLKGSPLAAKTIGRMLEWNLSIEHWENILKSELWQEEQEPTDILPALRLSYLYLPRKLKRCFSVCAMYPKDHKFGRDLLANIWIAQGYVVGSQEASLCFDALANRSFFQKASPRGTMYVIHDLMHDTACLISKDECFVIKHASDLNKVPSNIRHLSVFANGDVQCSELMSICKKKKLRSLICNESYAGNEEFNSVIKCWFKELSKLRFLSFRVSNVTRLPASIGNSKHLRYLCLLGSSTLRSFPSEVCRLHLLKFIDCGSCTIGRFPSEFTDVISLQRIKSRNFTYDRDQSDKLCLKWSGEGTEMMENQMEVLPHCGIQQLHVEGYEGDSCPSWLQPNLLPMLRSVEFSGSGRIKRIPFFVPPDGPNDNAAGLRDHGRLEDLVVKNCGQINWQGRIVLPTSLRKIELHNPGYSMDHFVSCFIDLNYVTYLGIFRCESLTYIPLHVWRNNLQSLQELNINSCNHLTSISSEGGDVTGFSSLAKICIVDCALLSLEELLTPDCVPVVRDICVFSCKELMSLAVDRLDGLQKLTVICCYKVSPQSVMTFPPSLKMLDLSYCYAIESINLTNTQLGKISIVGCKGLRSIGGATTVANIKEVDIRDCPELVEIQQPLLLRVAARTRSSSSSRVAPRTRSSSSGEPSNQARRQRRRQQ